MTYQIIKVIAEVNDFEEACILAGLNRQPAFDELPGELFWSNAKKIGVFAIPDPADALATAALEFVSLFDGRLVLDDADDDTGEPQLELSDFDQTGMQRDAIPIYRSAAEYFAANPEPQRDDADALTDDEAEELAEASAAAANLFLKEMGNHGTA